MRDIKAFPDPAIILATEQILSIFVAMGQILAFLRLIQLFHLAILT